MSAERKFVCLLLPLLLLTGCNNNQKARTLPPKLEAPTVAVVLPDEIPLSDVPGQESAPIAPSTPTEPPPKVKPKKPARNSSNTAKKTAPVTPPAQSSQPPSNSTQTVATLHSPKNSGTDANSSSTLVAAVPSAQLTQQKEDTARMVDATENALKGLNRSLTDEEKSMRSQIQSFLQQSRKATTDGDYERAFNLAKKAQLLADALVKK